jgi:hypothetical protein
MILVGVGGPPFTICTKYVFLVLFHIFWPAQSSPATEILHAALIGPGDYWKNQGMINWILISAKNHMSFPMCPLSLSVIFQEKIAGIPNHCSFQHPQFERHTNNLHFKKNLVRIGLPNQKLLNFDRKKSKFPTVRQLRRRGFVCWLHVKCTI